MKMNDFTSLHQLFSMYRKELGYSFVACLVAVARHWQARDPFREVVVNGFFCAAFAFGISNVLEFFGIDSVQWGYLASVFLGYLGVEVFIGAITEKLPFLKALRGNSDAQTK